MLYAQHRRAQTFGLDIYIDCSPLRQRATPADTKAQIQKEHEEHCCSHKTCVAVGHGYLTLLYYTTSLISWSRAVASINPPGAAHTHAHTQIYINMYICVVVYTRATMVPLLHVVSQEIDISAPAHEQKRKQYCCCIIYGQHKHLLSADSPTSATL